MTTFTNPHERIEQLQSRLDADVGVIQRLRAELADSRQWMAEMRATGAQHADRIRALEADLADSRLIAREQEDAHVAANMRYSAELALRQTAEAYAARNALRVIELEELLRKHIDHHDGCESFDWSDESDWITTSFGFLVKSDECSCGANQLALTLDPAAKAITDGYASETKSAPGFCPECLMTGGHKLRCSKAETTPKPITTFTGWIQGSCDNCGKSAREHVGISMGCPQAETFGVKP